MGTMTIAASHLATWIIAAGAIAGVVVRPFRWPEAVWVVAGAALLVAFGLVPVDRALAAITKGDDVYLFLVGMMLLSEIARREGLFDWVAAIAVARCDGSPQRLFASIFVVGIAVTAFLSNDATAVVLTPAVYAATKRARVAALPYLFICAFVANAASFVLPISNPANIVVYGDHTPPLGQWLARFALPSLLAIVVTYVALRFTEGRRLPERCEVATDLPTLSTGARVTLGAIGLTAVVLSAVSALDRPLGWPTALMGIVTAAVVLVSTRTSPMPVIRGVSWAILPLVAGLFVLVEALAGTGVIAALGALLNDRIRDGATGSAWMAGLSIALGSNVVNNLPAGLVASSVVQAIHPPQTVVDALLIGVDLGPNLAVTGSLATILWLTAIRREGEDVGFWRFTAVGAIVTTPALLAALAARLLVG
jgi:arsenical pump membrane protein